MSSSVAMRLAQLADAVQRRRRALGLRQVDVADLAGCSARFVHTLEHGKASLRLDKVLDVLEVLGLALFVGAGRGQVGAVAETHGYPAALSISAVAVLIAASLWVVIPETKGRKVT